MICALLNILECGSEAELNGCHEKPSQVLSSCAGPQEPCAAMQTSVRLSRLSRQATAGFATELTPLHDHLALTRVSPPCVKLGLG